MQIFDAKKTIEEKIEGNLKNKNINGLIKIFENETELNFSGLKLKIDGDDVGLITKALENNTSVIDIRFAATVNIGDIGAKNIGELLEKNKKIKSLELLNCNVGSTGIKHLSNGIKDNKILESIIILGTNPFGDTGMTHLCSALSEHPSIKDI